MPDLASYDYAYIRVMTDQASGEFVNAGVILFCRTKCFLDARVKVDVERLHTLDAELDVAELQRHLNIVCSICAGNGPIGELGQAESFHWLVAPHNTVVHASPVHCGVCADPEAELDRLMRLVNPHA